MYFTVIFLPRDLQFSKKKKKKDSFVFPSMSNIIVHRNFNSTLCFALSFFSLSPPLFSNTFCLREALITIPPPGGDASMGYKSFREIASREGRALSLVDFVGSGCAYNDVANNVMVSQRVILNSSYRRDRSYSLLYRTRSMKNDLFLNSAYFVLRSITPS